MKKRKTISQRLLALTLCLLCLLAALPIAALADDAAEPTTEPTAQVTEAPATPDPSDPANGTGEPDPSEPADPSDPVEDPSEPSEPVDPSEPTETLYDKLMAAESCQAVYALLNNAELADVEALDEQQLTALIDHVNTLPDDGYKSDLLLDLTHLRDGDAQCLDETKSLAIQQGSSGKAQFSNTVWWTGNERWTVEPGASGITVSAEGYTNEVTVEVGSSVLAGNYTLTTTKTSYSPWSSVTSTTYTINLTVTASPSGGGTSSNKQATVNSIVSHAVVTYYYYEGNSWKNGGIYTDGQTFSISYNKNETPSYYVFFAKPEDNYLLSTFSIVDQGTGGTSYDLYSVENVSQSNIKDYPNIDTLVQEASNNGYLTMNGYKTSAAGNVTLNQYFTGTQPGLTVSATATPNNNVKPGDEVTFHVTITPQKANTGDTVTSFEVTSLTINGVTYENVTLTANGDGTYSTDVKYEATATDWQTGNISLNVSAQVGYEYVLPVKDRDDVGSEITTNSTIISSGTTTVTLATASSVAYTLNYDAPEGITPPETIPATPTDDKEYYEGDPVTVKDYTRTDVDDPDNGGTWKFTGWKVNGQGEDKNFGDTVTMGTDKILFVGVWKFETYPTVTLTIEKLVDGNMGDWYMEFPFTVTVSKPMTADTYDATDDSVGYTVENDGTGSKITFELAHNQKVVLANVPIDATLEITESGNADYEVKVGDTTLKGQNVAGNATYRVDSVTKDMATITFVNKKDVTIDTGILLDTLPYILILAVVAVGAVVMVRKRHSRDED